MADLRYCGECGAKLLAQPKFCTSCGVPIPSFEGNNKSETSEPVQQGNDLEATVPKSRLWARPFTLVFLIALLIVVPVGLFFVVSSLGSEPEQTGGRSANSSQVEIVNPPPGQLSAQPSRADLEACIGEGSHQEIAEETSSAIQEMTSDLELATAIGTESALRGMTVELSTSYATTFIKLGQRWTFLTDCGDATLGGLTSSLGGDVLSLGLILRDVSLSNPSPLVEAQMLLEEIGDKSFEVGTYLANY